MLLQDFRRRRPDVTVKLAEDKTIRLLPRLLSGRLDLALVRPPEKPDRRLEFLFLLYETRGGRRFRASSPRLAQTCDGG